MTMKRLLTLLALVPLLLAADVLPRLIFTTSDIAGAGGDPIIPYCSVERDAYTVDAASYGTIGNTVANTYVAQRFVAEASYDMCKMVVYLASYGTPNLVMAWGIYSDSGTNTPGSLIGSTDTLTAEEVLADGGSSENQYTINPSASIVSGTTNWIVVQVTGGDMDVDNNMRWYRAAITSVTNSTMSKGTNDWNWVTSTRRCKFRLFSNE